MTGSALRHGWIVALAACALLAACSDDAPEKPAGGKPTAAAASKGQNVTANMVAAVSAGKSSSAVGVYFTLGNSPTVNKALPVDIAILPHQEFSSLRARFDSAGGGLTVISGDNLEPIENLEAEAPLTHKLTLMPQKPGVFMVTANLETLGDEGMVSRIFSIPVIVAPSAADEAAPAAAPAPTSD